MTTKCKHGNQCRLLYGAVDNYAETTIGESMYRFGYARCLECNAWYLITELREKNILRCQCCDTRLKFKAQKHSSAREREEMEKRKQKKMKEKKLQKRFFWE